MMLFFVKEGTDMNGMQHASIESIVTRHLGEGTLAVDRDGRVTFANPAALRHLGLREATELVGKEFHQVVHRERSCLSNSNCVLAQGLRTGCEVESHTDIFNRGDGRALPVAYTLTWIEEDDINEGAVIVFRDMSRYRDMQAKLMTTDRMTALGTLASGVAHEMNNPLAYVKSNVRYVVRVLEKRLQGEGSEQDDDALREALLDSLEGIGRMETIVAGMRSFTNVDDNVETVEAGKCLDDALMICGGSLRRHADIEVRQEGQLSCLQANAPRLTQVFVNLLLNAATAVEQTGARGMVEVVTRKVGDEQVVEIHDDGVGIEEELRERIYDPFFTTREAGEGTGLGLYISRCIVEELGGRLTFEGRSEGGTTFRVILPGE